MFMLSEAQHFSGNIDTLRRKAFLLQQGYKTACTATTNIQRPTPIFNKRKRPFVRLHAVIEIEFLALPEVSELIVGTANIGGCHEWPV